MRPPDLPHHRRCRRGVVLLVAVALPAPVQPAARSEAPAPTAVSPLRAVDDAGLVHVLNRLAWGPRPGDVEALREMGLDRWLERQIRPERIDDRALDDRLRALETVSLSSSELMKAYDPPREAKREIQARRAEMGDDATDAERRRARRELMEKYGSKMKGSPRQVLQELQAAKMLRAIASERQLHEVLVDFWLNHFNVYAQKGPVRFLVAEHERAIREHAWGSFEELLLSTARSPAMLFYLDNWLSVDPEAAARRDGRRRRARGGPGAPSPPAAARRSGLNENYARELLELHTLGVDGGYTQADVTEVARAFTGWTIKGLRASSPEFAFDTRVHARGDKLVLGRTIESAGEDEGREIVRMLARHPSTARFVSYKLARRLVADEPPAALVERAAATWDQTRGSIRDVVWTIVTSPELHAPEVRAAKVKSPLEFIVSAVRATGAEVTDARELARHVEEMGMPLYLQAPPTGYKDTAEAWVSTSGLVARLNFALDLAAGRVRGVSFAPASLVPSDIDRSHVAAALAAALVPAGLSDETRRTLEAESAGGLSPSRVAGLILGSPEFQRR